MSYAMDIMELKKWFHHKHGVLPNTIIMDAEKYGMIVDQERDVFDCVILRHFLGMEILLSLDQNRLELCLITKE